MLYDDVICTVLSRVYMCGLHACRSTSTWMYIVSKYVDSKGWGQHDLSSSFNLFMVQDFSLRPRVVWLVPSIHCLRSGITGQQPLPPGLYTALEPWISAHFLAQQAFNHSSISPDFVPTSLTFSWFALLQANTRFISILFNTLTLDMAENSSCEKKEDKDKS